jgi:hypothetical protein
MLEAVIWFGIITAVGEWIILSYLNPALRNFVTGPGAFFTHTAFAALNLWIHWGTITGSMTAVVAFVVSTCVCKMARSYWRTA